MAYPSTPFSQKHRELLDQLGIKNNIQLIGEIKPDNIRDNREKNTYEHLLKIADRLNVEPETCVIHGEDREGWSFFLRTYDDYWQNIYLLADTGRVSSLLHHPEEYHVDNNNIIYIFLPFSEGIELMDPKECQPMKLVDNMINISETGLTHEHYYQMFRVKGALEATNHRDSSSNVRVLRVERDKVDDTLLKANLEKYGGSLWYEINLPHDNGVENVSYIFIFP